MSIYSSFLLELAVIIKINKRNEKETKRNGHGLRFVNETEAKPVSFRLSFRYSRNFRFAINEIRTLKLFGSLANVIRLPEDPECRSGAIGHQFRVWGGGSRPEVAFGARDAPRYSALRYAVGDKPGGCAIRVVI